MQESLVSQSCIVSRVVASQTTGYDNFSLRVLCQFKADDKGTIYPRLEGLEWRWNRLFLSFIGGKNLEAKNWRYWGTIVQLFLASIKTNVNDKLQRQQIWLFYDAKNCNNGEDGYGNHNINEDDKDVLIMF